MKIKVLKQFAVMFLGLVLFANHAHAQRAYVALSDESAQIGYGTLIGGSNYGRTELAFDFLFTEEEAYVGDVSLQVFDQVGSKVKGLVAGIGGKIYALRQDNVDAIALGIGGMLRYSIPANKRFILGLDGYYAPSVVTFLDADTFYEIAARVEFEVIPQAAAFVEWRDFGVEHEDSNKTYHVDQNVRVGMEINF